MSRAVMQQALEALIEHGDAYHGHMDRYHAAITALRAALAEPEQSDQLPIEEALKRAYYYTEAGEWRGAETPEWDRWHAVAKVALAEPEQEPWSTRERFYAHLDQAVENIRQRMTIRTVTMRCKDFDYVLPIIDAMEGHVLVGPAPTPRKPLTDEEIHAIYDEVARREPDSITVARRHIARAIERAHGIGEQT